MKSHSTTFANVDQEEETEKKTKQETGKTQTLVSARHGAAQGLLTLEPLQEIEQFTSRLIIVTNPQDKATMTRAHVVLHVCFSTLAGVHNY